MSRGILAVTSGGVEVVLPVDPESLKVAIIYFAYLMRVLWLAS